MKATKMYVLLNRTATWFVAKDVGEILEMTVEATRRLDDDEKGLTNIQTPGGNQSMTIISESGLYTLIMRSNKPEAKHFRKWVTGTVLPSIRKHGFYATPAKVEEILQDPDNWIKVLTALKAEREKALSLAAKNVQLEAKIEEDKPKVIFAEAVDASKDSILIGVLAGILRQNGLDIGQTRLFNWLRNHGYLCKTKGYKWNFPTQKSLDLGLFEVKERIIQSSNGINLVRPTPMVTGKGQIFFIEKF